MQPCERNSCHFWRIELPEGEPGEERGERWTIFRQTYGKGRVEAIDGPDTRRIAVVPESTLLTLQAEIADLRAENAALQAKIEQT